MLTSNGPSVAPGAPAVGHQTRLTHPDPEVAVLPARARRRQFTVAYKLRILHETNHTAIGQLGALLRREGLYSSHLTNWRRQRAQGTLAALTPQRRGRPAPSSDAREVAQLREENERLARKLVAAETVIEIQKKVATLLGATLPDVPESPWVPSTPTAGPQGTGRRTS